MAGSSPSYCAGFQLVVSVFSGSCSSALFLIFLTELSPAGTQEAQCVRVSLCILKSTILAACVVFRWRSKRCQHDPGGRCRRGDLRPGGHAGKRPVGLSCIGSFSHHSTHCPSLSLGSNEAEGFASSMGQRSPSAKQVVVKAEAECHSSNKATCHKRLSLCQQKSIWGNSDFKRHGEPLPPLSHARRPFCLLLLNGSYAL